MTIEISSGNVTVPFSGIVKIQAVGQELFPVEISVEDLYKKIKGKELDNPLGIQQALEIKIQFNEFWKKYGLKVKKKAALSAWKKLTGLERSDVLRNVEDFVKANPDVKFRPHPSSYLNGRRWEDELPEHVVRSKSASPEWAKPNTWGQ